jgi:hypothetical protein
MEALEHDPVFLELIHIMGCHVATDSAVVQGLGSIGTARIFLKNALEDRRGIFISFAAQAMLSARGFQGCERSRLFDFPKVCFQSAAVNNRKTPSYPQKRCIRLRTGSRRLEQLIRRLRRDYQVSPRSAAFRIGLFQEALSVEMSGMSHGV